MDVAYVGYTAMYANDVARAMKHHPKSDFTPTLRYPREGMTCLGFGSAICGARFDLILIEKDWRQYFASRKSETELKFAENWVNDALLCRLKLGGQIAETNLWHTLCEAGLLTP